MNTESARFVRQVCRAFRVPQRLVWTEHRPVALKPAHRALGRRR